MSKIKNPGMKPAHQKKRDGEVRTSVRFKCALNNTIIDVLRQRPGWTEVKDDAEWDFYWCDVGWIRENFDHTFMEDHVRICHFRNHYELTRKNLMAKNLRRFLRAQERGRHGNGGAAAAPAPPAPDFCPLTFTLPADYHLFVEEFKRSPGLVWIMKPIAKSQGKGIFLFRKLKDITDWKKDSARTEEPREETVPAVENYVVQRYIEKPYLIGGRKFDLRVYVLVTSFVPLRAWLYREGFARFSNARFSLDSIDDNYVHLTNVAIQKTAPDYDPDKGCKWSLLSLRRYLTARHGEEEARGVFAAMETVIMTSLHSVRSVIINDKHCFELYGYDVLLDHRLQPWLLEVNASPSLAASGTQDYALKFRLLQDTLSVVDMEGRLSGNERQVGGFDLMWNDGPVLGDIGLGGGAGGGVVGELTAAVSNTHLGCYNDRKKQLRQLFQQNPSQKRL